MNDFVELLFFDTFAHENSEEVNLDLVQFTKPVYITEVRIIPLGARVQADFPGGVRLGATNPSQFNIEFFVNDLGKPGASTFESLGSFEYSENGCINLDCISKDSIRKIPTDGLVLKGWYTTITLAVYGSLTKEILEQFIQQVNPVPQIPDASHAIPTHSLENEWSSDSMTHSLEYNQPTNTNYQAPYVPHEVYNNEYHDYFGEAPKDPRNFHHGTEQCDWSNKVRPRSVDLERDIDKGHERHRDLNYPKVERDRKRSLTEVTDKDRENTFTSQSHDNERRSRDSRDDHEWNRRDHDQDAYKNDDYRRSYDRSDDRDRDRDRPRDRDRDRERDKERERDRDRDQPRDRERDKERHGDRDRENRERDERKRPRTPPSKSPKRPKTPQEVVPEKIVTEIKPEPEQSVERFSEEIPEANQTQPMDDSAQIDIEEFEPILSDEDIPDENEPIPEEELNKSMLNEESAKPFVPGMVDLSVLENKYLEIRHKKLISTECLKTSIGIIEEYFKSSITKYEPEKFESLNAELKEEFVHVCDKLSSIIGSQETFHEIVCLYDKSSCNAELNNNIQITGQIEYIVCTIIDWFKIALSYEMAIMQNQPTNKLKHIKCGLRLAEWCCKSENFIKLLWSNGVNIHLTFFHIFTQEHMAISLKLLALRALDVYVQHRFVLSKFLKCDIECGNNNDKKPSIKRSGYDSLLHYLYQNRSVRIKFSIISLLKKIHVFEMLTKLEKIVANIEKDNKILAHEIKTLSQILNQIFQDCYYSSFKFSQPKRFLPCSWQFDCRKIESDFMIKSLRTYNFLHLAIFLLNADATLNCSVIRTSLFGIIEYLSETKQGLEYLFENAEETNTLVKSLMLPEEGLSNRFNSISHAIGVDIAYKMETIYHLKLLFHYSDISGYDCLKLEVVDAFVSIFALTLPQTGRESVAKALMLNVYIKLIFQFFSKDKSENNAIKLKQSPIVGYIVDLFHLILIYVPSVTFFENHSEEISHFLNYQGIFEDSNPSKLTDIRICMELLQIKLPKKEKVAAIVDEINAEMNNILKCPILVIVGLRILQRVGISLHSKSAYGPQNPYNNYTELKFKRAILQLYGLDGTSVITNILQKFAQHYDSPIQHTHHFVGPDGTKILNVIQPCLLLLKEMLKYAIQTYPNFKDLTAVPVLLQIYHIMILFPNSSTLCTTAHKMCQTIIDILLTYTQPVVDELTEKDSLYKALWTQMCRKVIEFTTSLPSRFFCGLLIFSELLPLPLPLQSSFKINKMEVSWSISIRKLWSAHLYPLSGQIQELVTLLCATSNQRLLNLLRRVCVQLSDLSANTAIILAKGILDTIMKTAAPKDEEKLEEWSRYLESLLNLLACLVTHSTLKCAVLSLLHTGTSVKGKTDEKYANVVSLFPSLLKLPFVEKYKVQAQECILSIVQSLCDIEITLFQNCINEEAEISSDNYLSNSLPTKEFLIAFISAITEHLSQDNHFVTYLPIIRTFLLLTDHDYGFYHLRECLIARPNVFVVALNKLANGFSTDSVECFSVLNVFLEFLRVSITVDETEEQLLFAPRTIRLTVGELKNMIGWNLEETNDLHPLLVLQAKLEPILVENVDFEAMHAKVSEILKVLNSEIISSTNLTYPEPVLSEPESLLAQFERRSIYNMSDNTVDNLSMKWQLLPSNEENDSEVDNITCDLNELCRQDFAAEFNLIKEVGKLCCVTTNESSTEKERKELPSSKTRGPYVTPARVKNFPRNATQRPDIFRSRAPNTSRPPSLHVDDFVALETCGAQPTGPTGYNKLSRDVMTSRNARGSRGRALITSERAMQYRQLSWWGGFKGML